ncbi:myosin IB heavy chain [Impatiens glandulifera]|uniref:myosin IB heavy chain n=1 Tax=Impatiens glandulifera TaxID=253017 RepID=UPI001FB17E23|nr:myosin IB heavy chain [Impatiens glandulifera]
MSRSQSTRRVQIGESQRIRYDDEEEEEEEERPRETPSGTPDERENSFKLRAQEGKLTEDQEPFMGVKVRRKASILRDYRGDYINVPSRSYIMKILEKQGDKKVLFADKVLKFTSTGKMKKQILLITDYAIYTLDPTTDALKRRIALAAVEKLSLSELSDNFIAISIPTEYDMLMASTRKTEIVTILVEAIKESSNYELEVHFANKFEYLAAANIEKEVIFEEVEGGVRTRMVRK